MICQTCNKPFIPIDFLYDWEDYFCSRECWHESEDYELQLKFLKELNEERLEYDQA